MHSPFQVEAYAKINLFLNVLGLRDDGFHELYSVMQTLRLADVLDVEPQGEGLAIHLECTEPGLQSADNLVVRAYHLFYHDSGLPPVVLRVRLHKQIPVKAGLGGASSDAAAMLMALNQLHQHRLDLVALQAIAAQLGSDVPFFLTGGTGLVTGRGEIISKMPALPPQSVVLLKPKDLDIATPEAYGWLKAAGQYREVNFSAWEALIANPGVSVEQLGRMLHNDFEAVLYPRFPKLSAARQALLDAGLPGVQISGSGPTLFGLLSDSEAQLPKVEGLFSREEWLLIPTEFLSIQGM